MRFESHRGADAFRNPCATSLGSCVSASRLTCALVQSIGLHSIFRESPRFTLGRVPTSGLLPGGGKVRLDQCPAGVGDIRGVQAASSQGRALLCTRGVVLQAANQAFPCGTDFEHDAYVNQAAGRSDSVGYLLASDALRANHPLWISAIQPRSCLNAQLVQLL